MGLIGLVAYIVQAFYFIVLLPKKFKSRQILFISLAYWVTYTITSIPGFNTMMFYLIIFYFIKSSEKYKQMAKEGNVYGVYFSRGEIHYNIIKRGIVL